MGELLTLLEYLVTLPGRVMVWFRWALPNNADYHDDAFRDGRVWRWIFSAIFYVSAWRIVDLVVVERLAEAGAANMIETLTGTLTETFGGR